MKILYSVLLFILHLVSLSSSRYVLPDVKIEALSPKGIRVSMPVTPGANIQLFGFHANVNKPITGKEEGDIKGSSTTSYNGRWVIIDNSVNLKVGDKVNYWIFAQSNRLGYDKSDQVFEVTELSTVPLDECDKSETQINDDELPCRNSLIFEDEFNDNKLNESLWEVLRYSPIFATKITGEEFVSYENNRENLFISNGILHIKPTLAGKNTDELFSKLPFDLRNGCSIDDDISACYFDGKAASFHAVPPIRSARIRSKYAFKYGRVEIEAKLPIGDWIVPHILLEPRDHKYGSNYKSGELYVAYARGNRDLMKAGEHIGQKAYYCGPSITDDRTEYMNKYDFQNDVGAEFRTYALEFKSDGITCWAGSRKIWDYKYPASGFRSQFKHLKYTNTWSTKAAPFDQYFHVTIGVTVGGIADFGGIADKIEGKPWENSEPRKSIFFFEAQNIWSKTWDDENSVLKVKNVRFYSL